MKASIIAAMVLAFSLSTAHAQQWDEVVQRRPYGKPRMVKIIKVTT